MSVNQRDFRPVSVLLLVALLAGCQSGSPSRYVSPRVMGRVLDEKSGQPVKGVEVKRVVPDYEAGTLDQVRGGEVLERGQPLRTDAEGKFDLASQKSVALFRDIGWFSVEIAFYHRDYERFNTNYTARLAQREPSGEPVIAAGDILLTPKSR